MSIARILTFFCIIVTVILGTASVQSSERGNAEDLPKEQTQTYDEEQDTEESKEQSSGNTVGFSIDEILRLPSLEEQTEALSDAVAQCTENHAFDIFEATKSIRDSEQRKAFLNIVFPQLSRFDLRRTLVKFDSLAPVDQFETVEAIYANVLAPDSLEAVRASNKFSFELQERALLALLSTSQDVELKQIIEFAKIAPVFVGPLINELDGYTEQLDILAELVHHWAQIDLQTTLELIKALHADTADDRVLSRSLSVLASTHPTEALVFSHNYFRDFGSVLEARIFSAIAENDLHVARELFPKVRRIFPSARLFYLDSTMVSLGPEYAIEFGRSLSAEESERFFWFVTHKFCDPYPQVFSSSIRDTNADEAISKIALCVILTARQDPKLTSSEFEKLYEYLVATDLQEIDKYPKSSFIKGHTD